MIQGGLLCATDTGRGPGLASEKEFLYELAKGFNFPLDYHYITCFEVNVIDLNSCLFNR
jgi:hypothetical protein